VKGKLMSGKDPERQFRHYVVPDYEYDRYANGSYKNIGILGDETFYKGARIGMHLYKSGEKHGVQCEWYSNGKLKSEAPYKFGVRHGVFRHWDEKGRLVGQYEIRDGVGTVRVYNSDGVLALEESFDRKSWLKYNSGYFQWSRDGARYDFLPDGSLERLSFLMEPVRGYGGGIPHGPLILWNADGAVREKKWYLKGREVSEEAYAEAARADADVPAYHADAGQYKAAVPAEVKALELKYRTLPKVRIPLTFDAQGLPLPASE
jgi:hypothetical protein